MNSSLFHQDLMGAFLLSPSLPGLVCVEGDEGVCE